MKGFNNIVYNLDSALDFLESEKEDILEKAEEGILIAKRALEQLRNNVVKKKFKSINFL